MSNSNYGHLPLGDGEGETPAPKKRNPLNTMLGISLGMLVIVVAILLSLSNVEAFREFVKKIF